MKMLLMSIAFSLSTTSFPKESDGFLNTDPIVHEINSSPSEYLLTIIEEIQFRMSHESAQEHFSRINFNTVSKRLSLSVKGNITYLELINAQGQIDYQVPVFSETVTIDLNDLEKGDWNMNIIVDNDTTIPASFSNL